METRTISIHAFASASGGVGKSTMAVLAAETLATLGRTCLLIDADLTGSSLADGLELEAPVVATCDDGSLDLAAAPTGRHLTVAETIEARERRRQKRGRDTESFPYGSAYALPYFHDAILYRGTDDEHDCRLDAIC